jgi:hypothetical protein
MLRYNAKISLAYELTDKKLYNDIHQQHEFRLKFVNEDDELSHDEKKEAGKVLSQIYDSDKVFYKSGKERNCENCNQKCLATLFCEFCVRNYLKANYLNWTSGNDVIDNLIRKCQSETLKPDMVIEWIPFNKLKDIEYLTKGGFSEIYTANWIDGQYKEWDSKERQLIRSGKQEVIIKNLENVESANRSWFEEVCNLKL